MPVTQIMWGPVGTWVGAAAPILIVTVTVLVALGYFEGLRGPRIRITFEPHEPWCRYGTALTGETAFWVRLGVENAGRLPAQGCIGRMISVTTNGVPRDDVDPLQLRWAGLPRSVAFNAIDLRRGQREFLNMLCLSTGSHWHIVTFEDPDFDPGFNTDLPLDQHHEVQVSVFANNTAMVTARLVAEANPKGDPTGLHLE